MKSVRRIRRSERTTISSLNFFEAPAFVQGQASTGANHQEPLFNFPLFLCRMFLFLLFFMFAVCIFIGGVLQAV
jgi:hypothetical protein